MMQFFFPKLQRKCANLVLLCCLLLGFGVLCSGAPIWAISQNYGLGLEAFRQQNYVLASQFFLKAKDEEPQNTYLLYYLADSLLRQNKLDEAQVYYQHLLVLAPASQAARLAAVQLSLYPQLSQHVFKAGTEAWRVGGVNKGQAGSNNDSLFGLDTRGVNYFNEILYNGKVLRWSLLKLPLHLYIERSPKGLNYFTPAFVEKVGMGMNPWVKALGQQLSYIQVQNPDEADIKVRFSNGVDQVGVATEDGRVYTAGITVPELNNNGQLRGMNITLATMDVSKAPISPDELYFVAVHEFGHALGLLGHSKNPNDIMHAEASHAKQIDLRDPLSKADVATIRRLYSSEAEITNLPPEQRPNVNKQEQWQKELAASNAELDKRKEEVAKRPTSLNLVNLANGYLQRAKLLQQHNNRSGESARSSEIKQLHNLALDVCNRAIANDGSQASAYQSRSVAHEGLQALPDALDDITLAIKLNPKEPAFYLQQAWVLSKLNKKSDAKVALSAYTTLAPNGKDDPFYKQIITRLGKQ